MSRKDQSSQILIKNSWFEENGKCWEALVVKIWVDKEEFEPKERRWMFLALKGDAFFSKKKVLCLISIHFYTLSDTRLLGISVFLLLPKLYSNNEINVNRQTMETILSYAGALILCDIQQDGI